MLLYKDIKRVAIGIDRTPQPEFLPANWQDSLIQMPLVDRTWTIALDTARKSSTKTIDPQSNDFSGDDGTAFCEQIFNIGCAEGKPELSPNRIRDGLSGITETFKAWHRGGFFMSKPNGPHNA